MLCGRPPDSPAMLCGPDMLCGGAPDSPAMLCGGAPGSLAMLCGPDMLGGPHGRPAMLCVGPPDMLCVGPPDRPDILCGWEPGNPWGRYFLAASGRSDSPDGIGPPAVIPKLNQHTAFLYLY